MKLLKMLSMLLLLAGVSATARAELQDQGLASIMGIIDQAIEELTRDRSADETEADPAALENASTTVVNLSRTLGTLSYSRLQCGEASVLAEFTQRVQRMPEDNRDAMRNAFQEGFDKSKEETTLLSQDECERLTRSRQRGERQLEADVDGELLDDQNAADAPVEEVVEESPEDPKFRHLRIAELSGQLAYRRKICQDEKVFNRDYNEYLETVPEEYRDEAKTAYWKGYKHGKRMNKGFTSDRC